MKSKHIQQAIVGFVDFCGVGGAGVSVLAAIAKNSRTN